MPDLEIDDLRRLTPDGDRPDLPLWHVQGHASDLRFRASGYRQYLWLAPRLASRTSLLPRERGGCSFDEVGFD